MGMVSSGLYGKCCPVVCEPENTCDYNATSRSFLRPGLIHGNSASPAMVSGFRDDRVWERENGMNVAAQAVVIGSKSTNEEDLARYFFPFGKTKLIVDEQFGATIKQDLLAQHFNIFTVDGDFRSEISIKPNQSVVGALFQVRKAFCIDEEKGRAFFAGLSFPILRVKNNLQFCENVINDGGGASLVNSDDRSKITDEFVAANMTEAFESCNNWAFGRISPCAMKKTGVGELELKLGYAWVQNEPYHLETYLGIKVPTSNKPSGEYLFEPITGNGHHWGIMFGNAMGVHIWSDDAKDRSLRMEINNHSQFLFNNTQCRSVDLVCKPWSRYIEVYRDEQEAYSASRFDDAPISNSQLAANYATPGINVLTLPLKVRPGFSHNTNTAAVFRSGQFQIEGGWNLFVQQAECVKLACPWVEGPAIKDRLGEGQTNPVRDMTGNFRLENIDPADDANLMRLQDYKLNLIKESDLDLVSATTPGLLSYTVYGTVGYNMPDRDVPLYGNIGGSYEFGHGTNAVMERWTIWAKLGASY